MAKLESSATLDKLVNRLSRMPGIGRKTAQRLAFYILKLPQAESDELSQLILDVKRRVKECSICCNLSDSDPCPICANPKRDRTMICVVEEASDLVALEKGGDWNGIYHVLGGVLSPLDGIGPDDLKIKQLLQRVKNDVSEVILATDPDTEGEATAIYIAKLLHPLNIKVTRIARGLPVGTDLQFADSQTLAKALQGRVEF
ncbi:MAG: recombination protein RecR [candidate division Zixibacteria bacterium]|nr:recombination protein RecR [candidate division Zixibacteria bacterium]